jgi:glycosyltransferase involved in cell wall biosynthesis
MRRRGGETLMGIREVGLCLRGAIYETGHKPKVFAFEPLGSIADAPLISCIMPTRGHLFPARLSIDCFLKQDYPHRELVVVSNVANSEVERYVAELKDPRIQFHYTPAAANVGELRNAALSRSQGELVAIWDDDDLSPPSRLRYQYSSLRSADVRATFLTRVLLWWPVRSRMSLSATRFWEGTMLAERAALPSYQSLVKGEDTRLVLKLMEKSRIATYDHPSSYCYVIHGRNICDNAHFQVLFGEATKHFDDREYLENMAELSAELPMADYAFGLFQTLKQQARQQRQAAPGAAAAAAAAAKAATPPIPAAAPKVTAPAKVRRA